MHVIHQSVIVGVIEQNSKRRVDVKMDKQLTITEMYDALEEVLVDIHIAGNTCEFHGEDHEEETGEDCEQHKCGIWMSAEEGNKWKADPDWSVFDYWGYDEDYEEKHSIMHVYKPFHEWLKSKGWWSEYYDAGTVMIYPR